MKVAILGSPEGWYVRDLQRAAAQLSLHTVAVPFSRLWAGWWFGASRSEDDPCATALRVASRDQPLADCEGLLVRTMPPGSLEQVVFRMDVLHALQQAGTVVINSPRALEAAVDKFLALARLRQAGLPTPETIACQEVDEAMAAFDLLGRDIVVKPLFGSEGRGIMRLQCPDLALRAFKTLRQLNAVIYLQKFVPHEGSDVRVLVIGEQTWAIRRTNAEDWRTNVSRGARVRPCAPGDDWLVLARQAASALGVEIAGVDLLADGDGRPLVLEVNAVPGWRALGRALKCDIAAEVLSAVVGRIELSQDRG